MRKNALLPMVLLLAATGCAYTRDAVCPKCPKQEIPDVKGQRQPAEERKALFCPEDECKVTVRVDENCNVRAEPYYLVMAGKGETTIVWQIKEGTFAPNPIRWKQAWAERVFTLEKSSATEIRFKNNRTIGVFNYGITVRRGDKPCPELDPTGINDMP
jgi:hypothetical protein